jgi:multicomponent Na+:H+ antiporter subunit C
VTPFLVYGVAAGVLVGVGIHGVATRRNFVRQILALNVMGGGTFLFLIAVAFRNGPETPDPVPQALILTGIVVSVSVSALALAIARALHSRSGRTSLPDEDLE